MLRSAIRRWSEGLLYIVLTAALVLVGILLFFFGIAFYGGAIGAVAAAVVWTFKTLLALVGMA